MDTEQNAANWPQWIRLDRRSTAENLTVEHPLAMSALVAGGNLAEENKVNREVAKAAKLPEGEISGTSGSLIRKPTMPIFETGNR